MPEQFYIRDTAPTVANAYYRHVSFGGYNRCIIRDETNGFVLPNCVGYAYGRFMEAAGITSCNLPTTNASTWIYTPGYATGSVPKLGAIVCYTGGMYGGAGHVCVVEQINPDGSCICSESNYSGEVFQLRTIPGNYEIGYGLNFAGFIYNPVDFDPDTPIPGPVDPDPPYDPRKRIWRFSAKILHRRRRGL